MDIDLYGHPDLRHLPLPERSRYIPQYDEEIIVHEGAFRRGKDHDNLPNSLTLNASRYHYCEACQTTWLVGSEGTESAKVHPSHDTLLHKNSRQSRRSMVVHVAGACFDDGATAGKFSAGIIFGPGSLYNLRKILRNPDTTKQTAVILAAANAVKHVREFVRPKREETVRAIGGTHSEHRWQDGSSWTTSNSECHRNEWMFRLIVVTDSSYVVECLCKHRRRWQLGLKSVDHRDNNGAPLPNGRLLGHLLKEINILSRDGVDVRRGLVDVCQNLRPTSHLRSITSPSR